LKIVKIYFLHNTGSANLVIKGVGRRCDSCCPANFMEKMNFRPFLSLVLATVIVIHSQIVYAGEANDNKVSRQESCLC